MAMGSYQAALEQARRSGQAGTIQPFGGTGSGVGYRFVPNSRGGGGMGSNNDAFAAIEQQYQKSQEAVNQRISEVMGIYDKVAGMFAPGGDFGKGFNKLLDQTKGEFIERGLADLTKRGLSNVTSAADLGLAFEKGTGAQQRASAYDRSQELYSQTLLGKAGAIERIEDVPPDLNRYAQLAQSAASSGGHTFSRTINSYKGFKNL